MEIEHDRRIQGRQPTGRQIGLGSPGKVRRYIRHGAFVLDKEMEL
ncbi:MAG: hypothetical protein WBM17_05750 [Anaerolineales bacterium]